MSIDSVNRFQKAVTVIRIEGYIACDAYLLIIKSIENKQK